MREILERAHVVQAIGQLYHHDADIIDHRQQHFPDVFRLARLRGGHIQPADFRDAFDEPRHVRPKPFFNARDGIFGVLNSVVKQRSGQRGGVHTHVREDVGDFQEV